MAKDYYDVLGVARDADTDAIKRAYRALAMKHHPDRNPGDKKAEQSFKDATEAYEVLGDEKKRPAYDRYGHSAFQNSGGGGGAHPTSAGFGDIFEDMFSEFADIMGTGRRGGQQRGVRHGSDLRVDVDLSLEEAFYGTEKTIEVTAPIACESCSGKGSRSGRGAQACGECDGTGTLRVQRGFFTLEQTCRRCQGRGRVIADACRRCQGSGQMRGRSRVSVKIPRGADNGTRIRVSEKGGFAGAMGGKNGDLYIFVRIDIHPIFQRENNTIMCRLPVSMTAAALGRSITLPSIDGGKVSLKVPAGSQTGDRFRLRGKGTYALQSAMRGDMIVALEVEVPRNLSERQRKNLEDFEKEEKKAQNPESESFLSRVGEFWTRSKRRAS